MAQSAVLVVVIDSVYFVEEDPEDTFLVYEECTVFFIHQS